MKKINKAKEAPPVALHAADEDGVHHLVGIGNLRVLIIKDEDAWFAQGVEIDYAAEGESVEDAKINFERGFKESLLLHLKLYGNIDKFLVFPSSEVLREAYKNVKSLRLYTHMSFHDLSQDASEKLPFGGIEYLLASAA